MHYNLSKRVIPKKFPLSRPDCPASYPLHPAFPPAWTRPEIPARIAINFFEALNLQIKINKNK